MAAETASSKNRYDEKSKTKYFQQQRYLGVYTHTHTHERDLHNKLLYKTKQKNFKEQLLI